MIKRAMRPFRPIVRWMRRMLNLAEPEEKPPPKKNGGRGP